MYFYVPKTLTSDFDSFLKSNVCYNIQISHNVCTDEIQWIIERAEVLPNKKISSSSVKSDDYQVAFLSKNSRIE